MSDPVQVSFWCNSAVINILNIGAFQQVFLGSANEYSANIPIQKELCIFLLTYFH